MEKFFKEKFNGDVLVAAILVVFGIVWTINGFSFGIWDRVTPGGGFMLIFVGIPLTCLCGWVLVNRIKNPLEGSKISRYETKALIIAAVSSAAGALLMNHLLGTMIALTIFQVSWFKFVAKLKWPKTIFITAVCMTAIYLIFVMWLRVRFPTFLDLRII